MVNSLDLKMSANEKTLLISGSPASTSILSDQIDKLKTHFLLFRLSQTDGDTHNAILPFLAS